MLGIRRVNVNDNYSSDESTPMASIVHESRNSTGGKHSIKGIVEFIEERNETIRMLELELLKSKITTRMSRKTVREELQWTGEDTNFVETVNNFCKYFLFPRTKFLKDGWQDFCPIKRAAYTCFVCTDNRDMWDRVIVHSISRKYQNMKCNLNNNIKSIYLSMKK